HGHRRPVKGAGVLVAWSLRFRAPVAAWAGWNVHARLRINKDETWAGTCTAEPDCCQPGIVEHGHFIRLKMICAALQAPQPLARKSSANQANHFPKDVRYIRKGAQTILAGRASHFALRRKSFG